ncbi:sensor histidine kinase [Hymenobacter convexus]|uniref:sensor histidine kinase n=1 Tax=Hymenobacter sp. CA1UV-4 TaxID=3063782 RepID=UPI0027139ADB|nr:histidine kinase [Hymenobacter sp. CA1UV-4]MDO7850994.1 histidine kinase [Hymenobacter sp. CA1UV-4]
MKTLYWLIGCWLLLAGPAARAQSLEQQPDRALSTVGIRDISSDPVGFAWVAARQGMFRYDGRQLIPLNQLVRQGPHLSGEATRVVADSAGTVWIGMYNGLYAFVPATGELRQVPVPPRSGTWRSALLLHRGALWIARGVNPYQLYRLPLRHPRQLPQLVLEHQQGVLLAIEPDSAGLLLFGAEQNWRLLPDGRVQPLPGSSHRYRVRTTTGARRAQVADHPLHLPHGPYYLIDSALVEHRAGQRPRVLARWPRGRFSAAVPHLDVLELDSTWYWLGQGELLALSIRRQRQPPRLQRTLLKLAWEWNGWLCFNRDRTGFWAFAEGMPGVVKLWPRQAPIQALPVVGGQHLSTRTIGRLADGRLMVGTYAGTFTQAADSPMASLRRWPGTAAGTGSGPPSHLHPWPTGAPEGVWFCSLRLPDARLVIGLENSGVVLLTGQQFQEITWPGPHPDLVGKTTFCLLRARAGQLWAGGQEGLFQLDLVHRTRRRYHEGDPAWPLHRCEIESMSEGAGGELWLATNRGLYCLQPTTGALRHYGPDEPAPYRLPTLLMRCVLATHPDSVWVGTLDAGLLLLNPRRGVQRQLTLGQGLPSEAVAFVLAPAPGRVLWVGTHNGLVRYEPRTGRRSDLTTAEGLATNELNRQSGWYDSVRQRLYVGGVGGLSVLVPQDLATAGYRPRLLLTSLTQHHAQPDTIRTDYLAGALPQGLELAPGDAFADLSLGMSDDIGAQLGRFAYRLLGSGPAPWQELGTGNRLRLQGLDPGDYTLEIRGETELGAPARNVLRVPVRARTYWWRRPGVWATLTGLLVALAAGGVYQWQQRRGRQRERYWQAEHALRQRIAADLHDDVGNLLTQISMHSSLLRETPHSPAQTVARLDALAAASRQAAQQMSDVVWGLDAEHLRLSQLLARMRDHAQEVLPPAGLNVRFQVSPDLPNPELGPDVVHNFYLIYKEALHNVVKHAQATTVIVTLAPNPTGLLLTMTDDGRGHDGQPRPGGHGLANMQARARAVGGTVCYQPQPTGFAVVVKLPLG